jgi:hypothetical protein
MLRYVPAAHTFMGKNENITEKDIERFVDRMGEFFGI